MKKINIFSISLIIILILYYLTISILIADKNLSFWICSIFTLIAIITQIIVIYTAEKRIENKPFEDIANYNNWSLYSVAFIFLIIQIILSVCLLMFKINLGISVILQAIILGIFIIIELSLLKSIEYIEYVEEKNKIEISFLENVKKEIEILKSNSNNKDELEDLYEVIRYSNPVSKKNVRNIENKIISDINKLKTEITLNNKEEISILINELKNSFKEREILLKK